MWLIWVLNCNIESQVADFSFEDFIIVRAKPLSDLLGGLLPFFSSSIPTSLVDLVHRTFELQAAVFVHQTMLFTLGFPSVQCNEVLEHLDTELLHFGYITGSAHEKRIRMLVSDSSSLSSQMI